MFNFLNNIGTTEWIIVAAILFIFFGGKRMSSLGKTAGEATKELKKAKKEIEEAVGEVKKDNQEDIQEEEE